MSENLRSSDEEQPEREEQAEDGLKEKEQTPEGILDALESAFEKGSKAELTVSEPSGGLRTSAVFIEGLEDGMLFVSESKSSSVMGIKIGDVKKVGPFQEEKE